MTQVWLAVFLSGMLALTGLFIFYDDLKGHLTRWFHATNLTRKLQRYAKNIDALYLNNLHCLTTTGHVLIIPHVLIGHRFVYVLTSRLWFGTIDGVSIDDKWLLYQGEKVEPIANPLKENEVMITFLANLLHCERNDFYNLVVLPSSANYQLLSPAPQQVLATLRGLNPLLNRLEKSKTVHQFTPAAIEKAANLLLEYHRNTLKEVR